MSDTGPLIALAIVELLPKLNRIFNVMHVPDVVYEEATMDCSKPGAQTIVEIAEKAWFKIEKINLSAEFKILADLLDSGEAAAIALAKQYQTMLLIDERKGRKIAQHYDITVVGTAAILIKAKQIGLISLVKPMLEKLVEHGYRFSAQLIDEVLKRSDEK